MRLVILAAFVTLLIFASSMLATGFAEPAASTLHSVTLSPILKPAGSGTPTKMPTSTRTATPTWTAIATRTSTPTVTATPTATATPTSAGLSIINVSQRTSSGSVLTLGEVRNDTGLTFYSVRISITFFDDSGLVAGTSAGSIANSELLPGMKSPFATSVRAAAGWKRYEVAIASYTFRDYATYSHDLSVINANAYWSDDDYYVVGQIRNDTSTNWSLDYALVALYDSTGAVIDLRHAYPATNQLDPGATTSFSASFYGSHLSAVSSYRIIVEGYRY